MDGNIFAMLFISFVAGIFIFIFLVLIGGKASSPDVDEAVKQVRSKGFENLYRDTLNIDNLPDLLKLSPDSPEAFDKHIKRIARDGWHALTESAMVDFLSKVQRCFIENGVEYADRMEKDGWRCIDFRIGEIHYYVGKEDDYRICGLGHHFLTLGDDAKNHFLKDAVLVNSYINYSKTVYHISAYDELEKAREERINKFYGDWEGYRGIDVVTVTTMVTGNIRSMLEMGIDFTLTIKPHSGDQITTVTRETLKDAYYTARTHTRDEYGSNYHVMAMLAKDMVKDVKCGVTITLSHQDNVITFDIMGTHVKYDDHTLKVMLISGAVGDIDNTRLERLLLHYGADRLRELDLSRPVLNSIKQRLEGNVGVRQVLEGDAGLKRIMGLHAYQRRELLDEVFGEIE